MRREFLDSYGFVLLLIVATYALSVTLVEPWGATIIVFVQMVTVSMTLKVSRARRTLRIAAGVALVIAGVAAAANLIRPQDETLVPYVFLTASLLYVVAPFSIVRHVARRDRVDKETLLGALASYTLIGMAFAFAYTFLGAIQSSSFFGADGDGTVADDLFFSFITLTTTGYGNLVPAGNPGQSLAVLEALVGQLFLVTAVAKVVSSWTPRRRTAAAEASAEPGSSDDD